MEQCETAFWEKVNKQGPILSDILGPCWVWTGCKDHRPVAAYGQFNIQGKRRRAHVFAWMLEHGAVPEGMKVCHKCDNGLCVRETHLFLGTQKQNIHDAMQKGRHIKGETCGHAKLTEIQVHEIRHTNFAQYTSNEIAAQYRVTRATINHIRYNRTWRHVQ
jgi:hypothetical protein